MRAPISTTISQEISLMVMESIMTLQYTTGMSSSNIIPISNCMNCTISKEQMRLISRTNFVCPNHINPSFGI